MADNKKSNQEFDNIWSELGDILGGKPDDGHTPDDTVSTPAHEEPAKVATDFPLAHFTGIQETHVRGESPFDHVRAFSRQVEPKIAAVEADCLRLGVPYQLCFEVKADLEVLTRRHYLNENVPMLETQTAYMLYDLPHAMSHIVTMFAPFTRSMPGFGYPPINLNFDHLDVFDDTVLPRVLEVTSLCQMLGIAYQMAFIPQVTVEGYQMRGALSPNHEITSCQMKAAFQLYMVSSLVRIEVLDMYHELLSWADEGDLPEDGENF